ncbi:hypothetical protein D3C79_928190 [compost metagenome]
MNDLCSCSTTSIGGPSLYGLHPIGIAGHGCARVTRTPFGELTEAVSTLYRLKIEQPPERRHEQIFILPVNTLIPGPTADNPPLSETRLP